MRRLLSIVGFAALVSVSCAPTVNVQQEQTALMQRDRDWSAAAKQADSFMSFLAADATMYAPDSPAMSGADTIKATYSDMMKMPGFNLSWTATKAVVNGDGVSGYTTGTYTFSAEGIKDEGKYITIWKKVNGTWVVAEDIYNSSKPPVYAHSMVQTADLKWGGAPPGFPEGAKYSVVSGNPFAPGPFVVRIDAPAGFRIPPHWHPTTENVTVLSGTASMSMGDKDDPATRTDVPAGGYIVLPAEARHAFTAKTNVTVQVHGTGPFAITYVNAADDPRNKK